MLGYLRKIGPFALSTAGLLALAFAAIGVAAWLNGSFVLFTSAADFWRRLTLAVVLVLAAALLCGIAADLEDRLDAWRERNRNPRT